MRPRNKRMKPISRMKLAEALGISQPTATKNIQAGMPADDIEAARAWRGANVTMFAGGRGKSPATPAGEVLQDSGGIETTERLRAIAVADFSAATTIQERAAASRTVKDIELAHEARKRDAVAVAKEEGSLMHRDEVIELYQKGIGQLRGLLESMAASVAHTANPSDPELAQQAIDDYLEQVFSTMSKP